MCLDHLESDAYELVSSFGRGQGKVTLRNLAGDVLEEFVGEAFDSLDPSDKPLKLQCRQLTDMLNGFRNSGDVSADKRKKLIPSQPFLGSYPNSMDLQKSIKLGA